MSDNRIAFLSFLSTGASLHFAKSFTQYLRTQDTVEAQSLLKAMEAIIAGIGEKVEDNADAVGLEELRSRNSDWADNLEALFNGFPTRDDNRRSETNYLLGNALKRYGQVLQEDKALESFVFGEFVTRYLKNIATKASK